MCCNTGLKDKTLVVFVGHSPSRVARSTIPFDNSTVSGKRLMKWILRSGVLMIANVVLVNIRDRHSKKLSALDGTALREKIKNISNAYGSQEVFIITLGKEVSSIAEKIGLAHMSVPHPSGLNRKLNDPAVEQGVALSIKRYVSDRLYKSR